MNYGIPYQGSKSRIAKDIIDLLPNGSRFVDLFAGGCAMTHAAILSGKYEKFLCNDLYPSGSNLFRNALNGEYNKPEYLRWVSREDFFKEKDTDDFVKFCYSFGNNGNTYMYSKELEPLKKGFHYAVVFNDWRYLEQYAKDNNWREGLLDELKKSVEGIHTMNERRLKMTKPAFDNGIIGVPHNMVQSLERINRLQNLDIIDKRRLALHRCATDLGIQQPNHRLLVNLSRWSRIDAIKELETGTEIDFTQFDYKDYQHEEGDVVYCDPPYAGTGKYDRRGFDHDAFWEWVRTRDYPVYVSEYNAPDDFMCVWEKGIPKKFAGGKSAHQKAIEKVFIHGKWGNDDGHREN